MENEDIFVYSFQNMQEQLKTAPFELGYYKLKFFTKDGFLATEKTDELSEFYLYPSGGCLRDKNMNIVFYDSRFDMYKGFIKPRGRG